MKSAHVLRTLPGVRDLLALAVANPRRYPCLLESLAHGGAQARYDVLFAYPQDMLALHRDGRVRDAQGRDHGARFLDALDATWRGERDVFPSPPGRRWRAAPDEGSARAERDRLSIPSPPPPLPLGEGSINLPSAAAGRCFWVTS